MTIWGRHRPESRRIQSILGGVYLHGNHWKGVRDATLVREPGLLGKIRSVVLGDPHDRAGFARTSLELRYVKDARFSNGMFRLHDHTEPARFQDSVSSIGDDFYIIGHILDDAARYFWLRNQRDRSNGQPD